MMVYGHRNYYVLYHSIPNDHIIMYCTHIEIGTLVVSIPAGMMTMPQSGYPLSRNIPDTQAGKRLAMDKKRHRL